MGSGHNVLRFPIHFHSALTLLPGVDSDWPAAHSKHLTSSRVSACLGRNDVRSVLQTCDADCLAVLGRLLQLKHVPAQVSEVNAFRNISEVQPSQRDLLIQVRGNLLTGGSIEADAWSQIRVSDQGTGSVGVVSSLPAEHSVAAPDSRS